MIYEWDPVKAERNRRKHGVSFDEASTVFRDPFAISFDDPDHSLDERRFIQLVCRPDSGCCSSRTLIGESIACASSTLVGQDRAKPIPIKNHATELDDDLRQEYDVSKLKGRVQGKHYAQATAGVTMVLLESDVAAAFPTGRAVNKALRSVLLAQKKATLANKALQPTSRVGQSGKAKRPLRAARG